MRNLGSLARDPQRLCAYRLSASIIGIIGWKVKYVIKNLSRSGLVILIGFFVVAVRLVVSLEITFTRSTGVS